MAKPIIAGGTLASRHSSVKPTTSGGGNALVSDHSVARDGRTQIKGTSVARHHTVSPNGNSGTIGSGQPLKMNTGGKEPRNTDTPLGKVYRRSTPK